MLRISSAFILDAATTHDRPSPADPVVPYANVPLRHPSLQTVGEPSYIIQLRTSIRDEKHRETAGTDISSPATGTGPMSRGG